MENRIESGDGGLRVQMLGRFAMHFGDAPVVLNKAVGAKSIRLLQMLFLSGRGGISKKELIDGLYGWSDGGDSANHNKNLNNLLYRLRSQLVASGLPDEDRGVREPGAGGGGQRKASAHPPVPGSL